MPVSYIPDPLSVIELGDPAALVAMFSVAERVPAAAGLNEIDTAQDAAGARILPHVVVLMKSAGFAPPIAMELIVKFPSPVLLKLTV